ncbi:MAG: TlyA family RNA methyltransferase [Firmicutes bacterium]|jgi:23S rRNA (cytidine1920-2'-O)/16S rRNA (cytidine1409-2'-O)-methyltransferase|nr:TlyA family RNA methyltransferase [Bacillota bacterium]
MPPRARVRLDQALVERGLAVTREAGKREILAGNVLVDGVREDKPGALVSQHAEILVIQTGPGYVSRGGMKLAHALDEFGLDVTGLVAVDIGASTGGFTDCLLKRGAAKVYAVDVGRGQLAWELRQDPRVVVMERTNARYLTSEMFPDAPGFGTVDVSFISLDKIIPPLAAVLTPVAQAVCLIKPQFEAGREKVGKRGVVRSPEVHLDVIQRAAGVAQGAGFAVLGLTPSPIRGPEGNAEFLVHLGRGIPGGFESESEFEALAQQVVGQAHSKET